MNRTLMITALLTAAVSTTAFADDLSDRELRRLRGSVRVDGSSTVYPITEAIAEEFSEKTDDRVRVTVGVSGTGGGFKRFSVGETDISDASRPIKGTEYNVAVANGTDFVEIPVAYDGLSIVVNTGNYWCNELTIDQLKKIFLDPSTVDSWDDVNPDWPNVPLKIFAPGTDSGTFDYFKEVVAGRKGSIRSDMSVSEDDNVLVRGVSGDAGGIGFFGCAYYFENKDKLKVIKIVNPKTGTAVSPSASTIESGAYAPFSRPLFIYVSVKSAERKEVDAFIRFYFQRGPALAEEVGYVKLPQMMYDRALKNYTDRKIGTQYLDAAGERINGPLTEVYK